MNDTLPLLTAYLVYNSPIIIALVWARFTSLEPVKRLMLLYAKVQFAAITFVFVYSFLIDALCDGSALKGYGRCTLVPLQVANLTLLIILIALAGLAAFGLFLLIYCGVKELRKSKVKEH
ncbi:MAG: hypothetical protein AAF700_07780 [Pseudomonadota bacterium]